MASEEKRPLASLTLVPTPIGNLDDITLRAIKVLEKVDTVLSEDTRNTGFLLSHLGFKKPLLAFHAHNEHHILAAVIGRMKSGEKFALVSDAGTPAISDPGFLVVREALANGLTVECLPGPTAFVPALVVSGFSSEEFSFHGFLPVKKGRQTMLKRLVEHEHTSLFYESPHRVLRTLQDLLVLTGPERRVSVSRELTKLFEETLTGPIPEIIAYFEHKSPKGEFVFVLEGKK